MRLHVLCPVVLAALLLAAPRAQASDVEVQAVALSQTLAFPGDSQAAFQLRITSHDAVEHFAVSVVAEQYQPDSADPQAVEGSPLGPLQSLEVVGAQLGGGTVVNASPACSPTQNRYHGYEPTGRSVDLTMAPQTTATVTVRFPYGKDAPWVDQEVRPRFELTNRLSDGQHGTLEAPVTVAPASPKLVGQHGVRIALRTTPATARGGRTNAAALAGGEPIDIDGTLQPALDGQPVELRYFGPQTAGRLRPLATVIAGAGGSFGLRGWRPPAPGYYELWAFVTPTLEGFTSDYACPRTFTVTPSDQTVLPTGAPASLSVRGPVRYRRGQLSFVAVCPVAELPTKCHATASSGRLRRTLRVASGQSRRYGFRVRRSTLSRVLRLRRPGSHVQLRRIH